MEARSWRRNQQDGAGQSAAQRDSRAIDPDGKRVSTQRGAMQHFDFRTFLEPQFKQPFSNLIGQDGKSRYAGGSAHRERLEDILRSVHLQMLISHTRALKVPRQVPACLAAAA